VLFVTIIFGLLGIGLFLVGRWGSKSNAELSKVPGYDQRSVQRRAEVLRRGTYTCYFLGAVFVLIAVVVLVGFRTDPISCAGLPEGKCPPPCVAEHRCAPTAPAH
jgi:hypothetical protein